MNHAYWIFPAQRVRLWTYLATLSLLLMDALLFALWYQALFAPNAPHWPVIFLVQFTILSFPLVIARGSAALHWRMAARQAALLAWIIAAVFASLKLLLFPDTPISLARLIDQPVHFVLQGDYGGLAFYHLIAVALVTWRGVVLARSSVTMSDASAGLQVGLIFLLLYGMLFAPFHPAEATLGLYAFLFFGLIAMATARIASLSDLRGGRIPRFGMRWMASVFAAGLVVVALAVLAGRLASERVIQIANTILFIIYGTLTALFLFVISPFLVMIAHLFVQMLDVIKRIMEILQNLANNPQLTRLINQLSQEFDKIMPYMHAGRTFGLALLVLAVLLGILLGMRLRIRFRKHVEEEAEAEQTGQPGSGNWMNLLRRFFENGPKLRLRRPGQMLAAARIRLIYKQLMQLSRKLGKERPPSRTPLEFLPDLQSIFPGEQDGLGLITSAYVKVRYGEYPETMREVQAVEAAWERLRRAGRGLSAPHRSRSA